MIVSLKIPQVLCPANGSSGFWRLRLLFAFPMSRSWDKVWLQVVYLGGEAHSSTLAWKIPWTEEPGRLWSVGLLVLGTTE